MIFYYIELCIGYIYTSLTNLKGEKKKGRKKERKENEKEAVNKTEKEQENKWGRTFIQPTHHTFIISIVSNKKRKT